MSSMSVPDLAPRVAHVASGDAAARSSFAFAFALGDITDLRVFQDGAALDGGYAITLNVEGPGGTIMLASPAPEGAEIVLLRATPLERATDFVENGAFRVSALNQELNRLTMMAQELSLALEGGLHRPASEAGATLVLPGAAARAGGLLGFGADGTQAVILPIADLRGEKGETGQQGPPGDMHGSMNLAELTDPAAARAKLSVLSQAEVDAAWSKLDAALDGLEMNLALNTLRDVVASGWSLLDMVDGVADAFADEAGVDTGASANASYDAESNSYALSDWEFSETGVGIGNRTATQTCTTNWPWMADSNATRLINGVIGESNYHSLGSAAGLFITVDFGSPVVCGKARLHASWNVTNPVPGYVSTYNMVAKLQGSNDGTNWVDLSAETPPPPSGQGFNDYSVLPENAGTAYRYARLLGVSGGIAYGSHTMEIEFATVKGPAVLVSVARTANTTPEAARAVLLVDPQEAITLNTELIVEISRDNGASWDAGPLAVAAQESASIQVLATGEVDLSAQPSAQAVRIRLRTPTGKAVWVHAWALQWR